MFRLTLKRSIGARLAFGNGALLGAMILGMSAVFFFGTVGVLDRRVDERITAISNRLLRAYGNRPISELSQAIDEELNDGIDTDSEIFLLTSPLGRPLAGNISTWPDDSTRRGVLVDRELIRNGKRSSARLIIRPLPSGGVLYVGRDLGEQRSIRRLVLRALGVAAIISVVMVVLGAVMLRRRIDARIGEIRRTANLIEAGNLLSRIAVSGDDEFARLSVDINRMLDRIENLVDGVRHVSNAVAHDLRAPFSRIRSQLDDALRRDATITGLRAAAQAAIGGIDDLILVFNKLLQIAEAESGLRAETFEARDLNQIARDMAELYDAAAEERGVRLVIENHDPVWALGDHDLLASAVASLIDNAIKYAGPESQVGVGVYLLPQGAAMVVRDNGPGVPDSELPRLTERFYRLDRDRSELGNGLGLSVVSAIATLHGGSLLLENTEPGFRATIMLPPLTVPADDHFRSR